MVNSVQRSSWCTAVLMLSIGNASAQVPALPQPPLRQPLFTVIVTSQTTRATDQARAQHVSAVRASWRMRIDSASGGTLFGRQPSDIAVQYYTDGQMHIPVVRARMQLPRVIAAPSRLREGGMRGRTGVLPIAIAERASRQATMREFITSAAAFDGLSDSVGTPRLVERDSAGVALTVTATRHSRQLGDSVVNARPVRVVRDSTILSLEQSLLVPSRFSSAVGRDAQSLRGTIVGTRVVDIGTGRTVTMHDTVLLRGRMRTNDGYGGVTELPRYEYSVREVMVHDSLSAPQVGERFDMVRTPVRGAFTPETREAAIARLQTEPSIRARDSIRSAFRFLRDTVNIRRIVTHALAVGDTAAAAQWMTEDPYGSAYRLTLADWRNMREWLRSATVARRVGVDRELLAITLVDALTHAPPVLLSAAHLPVCEPAACLAMASDGSATALPLRAVALVAAMVTSPRDWTDSVIANAAHNPLLETRALWFARGTSSTAVASAKAPIPRPSATAGAWWYWLVGQDSAYLRSRNAAAMQTSRQRSSVVHSSSEVAAMSIRFAAVRTGQSYAAALHRQRALAADDSTRALWHAAAGNR